MVNSDKDIFGMILSYSSPGQVNILDFDIFLHPRYLRIQNQFTMLKSNVQSIKIILKAHNIRKIYIEGAMVAPSLFHNEIDKTMVEY